MVFKKKKFKKKKEKSPKRATFLTALINMRCTRKITTSTEYNNGTTKAISLFIEVLEKETDTLT